MFFYLIDKKTFIPTLENCMYNYMRCSSLMFGARVRYGISFRQSEPGIHIYKRKQFHNFKCCIDNHNYENAFCDEIKSVGQYIVAKGTHIHVSSLKDF